MKYSYDLENIFENVFISLFIVSLNKRLSRKEINSNCILEKCMSILKQNNGL
jgi:hypothetical protein